MPHTRLCMTLAICLSQTSLLVGVSATAAPAVLYNHPAYESPIRAEPDDLILLPGYGFSATDTVVYQAISNTTLTPTHPSSIPATSSATSGKADIASVADAPYSLAIRLPSATTANQSYAIWTVNSQNEWSNAVKINDARPLWVTPDFSYATASLANLPRVLKVVGRNLQPAPGAMTQVKLIGPTTYTLAAVSDTYPTDPTAAPHIASYVAKVSLPSSVVPGSYNVQLSRDGVSWVPLLGEGTTSQAQTFTVQADPTAQTQFLVSDPRYGGSGWFANRSPRRHGQYVWRCL